MRDSYLYHFGIKGQKKGTRRFQYMNKTYTPAGNDRYRPSKGRVRKAAVATTAALSGAAWLAAINDATGAATVISTLLSTTLSSVADGLITLGSAFVAGVAPIPAAVLVMALPIAAMSLTMIDSVDNGERYVNRYLKENGYIEGRKNKW